MAAEGQQHAAGETTESIGVRELRQNASQYLRRVAAGESITVTDRGVPVAVLGPVHRRENLYDHLLAAGEILPAENPSGVLEGGPLASLDLDFSPTAELQRLRDEEYR